MLVVKRLNFTDYFYKKIDEILSFNYIFLFIKFKLRPYIGSNSNYWWETKRIQTVLNIFFAKVCKSRKNYDL